MTVLNFEQMQQHVSASVPTTEVEAFGGRIRLRKLAALAFVKISQQHADMEAEAKSNGLAEPNIGQNIDFLISLISLSVVDDDCQLALVSPEGRKFLGELDADQLLEIGNACLTLNGFTDADESEEATVDRKKKSSKRPHSGDSPSSSATT